MVAGQLIAAKTVTPSVDLVARQVTCSMKSLRRKNDAWLTRSSAAASRWWRPWA